MYSGWNIYFELLSVEVLAVRQNVDMLIVAVCSWSVSCHYDHNDAAFAIKKLLGIIRVVENSHYPFI